MEKLGDLFSLHRASKISLHLLIEKVFSSSLNITLSGKGLPTPICCCLSTSELFTFLSPVCVLGSIWSIVYRTGDRALEHGTSLAIKSAALGLYPPLEGIWLHAMGCLHFCLLISFVCIQKRQLVLFWITILPNCTLWDF